MAPARWPHVPEQAWITGARTDIRFNAGGRGVSMAELMAGLDGRLLIETGAHTVPDT